MKKSPFSFSRTSSDVSMSKVTHTKVTHTKKPTPWVASAFDGFDDFVSPAPVPPRQSRPKSIHSASLPIKLDNDDDDVIITAVHSRKRPRNAKAELSNRSHSGTKGIPFSDSDLWSDKHAPKSKADLAVHPKKVAEVEQWLQSYFHGQRKPNPILLLSGQAGAGKTATARVLAQQMKLDLQEWTNPVIEVIDNSILDELSGIDSYSSNVFKSRRAFPESQTKLFRDFLLRANKYQSLGIFDEESSKLGKIIVIEDYPNVFFRDVSVFHDILRRYVQCGRCPLVFIVSDSASGDSNERLLFPKPLQEELDIHNISFNPVAPTLMTKVLNRIVTAETSQNSSHFAMPSRSVIESICMSSSGDVRGAINALQFACMQDSASLNSITPSSIKKLCSNAKKLYSGKSKGKGSAKSSSSMASGEGAAIGARDTSLFLFRALGKILYCKRHQPEPGDKTENLPKHLSQHIRDPLQFSPEDVVERSHLSGEFFTSYLHQNYLDFYTTIDDVHRSSEYLSDADFLTREWASRSSLQDSAVSIAARGLIHSNSSRARSGSGTSNMGWRPLHKPAWFATNRKFRESTETARCLFRGHFWTPEALVTDLLPYLAVINITLNNTAQIAFLQELCRFNKNKFGNRITSEKLDEKDVTLAEEQDDSGVVESSSQKLSITQSSTAIDSQQAVESGADEEGIISNSQSNVKISTDDDEDDDDFVIDDYDY